MQVEESASVFAAMRLLHLAAHRLGDPVHAVADTEHRNSHRQHAMVAGGSAGIVSGTRSARENQTDGLKFADLVWSGGAWHNRREYLLLADAARNQLGVLTAKIDHDDAAALGIRPRLDFLHCGWAAHALLLVGTSEIFGS